MEQSEQVLPRDVITDTCTFAFS